MNFIPGPTHETTVSSEEGQTMAEYSVVLTLIVLVIGLGVFVVLADAIGAQFMRVAEYLS